MFEGAGAVSPIPEAGVTAIGCAGGLGERGDWREEEK
jgi:hypothetical protein